MGKEERMENIQNSQNDNLETKQNIGNGAETETAEKQEETKTYTQEEVDNLTKDLLTQEQVNKIIKERVAREKQKKEEEIKEAERLAKLSRDEREKELNEKTKKELEDARATIRRMNLEHDTEKILVEENLPLQFKSFLISSNEENTNENIKTFKKIYDKAVDDAVNERLKGKVPRASNVSRLTREEIMNIADTSERQKQILENIDLFN